VLGVIKGFSGLPAEMQDGVNVIGDSLFINTTYSFNSAVTNTYKYAHDFIERDGGTADEKKIMIKVQEPSAPIAEESFPDVVFDKTVSVFDKPAWVFKGSWQQHEFISDENKKVRQSMYSDKAGDELLFRFTGTGISLEGNWYKDGGIADVYVDGKLHRSIDTYYYFANQEHTVNIWHVFNLPAGDHEIRLVVKGEKRPEALGSRVYITSATTFTTGPKKNESWKFTFER
jgi:hypothetical protein